MHLLKEPLRWIPSYVSSPSRSAMVQLEGNRWSVFCTIFWPPSLSGTSTRSFKLAKEMHKYVRSFCGAAPDADKLVTHQWMCRSKNMLLKVTYCNEGNWEGQVVFAKGEIKTKANTAEAAQRNCEAAVNAVLTLSPMLPG
jgi:hypothetical protein